MVFSRRRAAPTAGSFALAAILLCACSNENSYAPPPPPKIDVALPVKQTVTPYLEATGSAAAVNTTPLVARVSGFIRRRRALSKNCRSHSPRSPIPRLGEANCEVPWNR